MCYSFKSSVASYTLGMASAIFAFATKQYIIGCLILMYCQMQLSEMLIWKGIDDNDEKLNETGTSIGQHLLAMHNIAIAIGITIAYRRDLRAVDFLPLAMGVLFYLFVLVMYYLPGGYAKATYPVNGKCDKDCQNPNNRLKWPYPHQWYVFSFAISLFLCMLYGQTTASKIWLSSVFTATFALTAILRPKVVGSVWCFMAAIAAPVIVGVNYFLI